MALKPWRIGLCGWGTVAQAFYQLCTEQADWIEQRNGVRIEVVALGCRREAAGCPVPQHRDLLAVANMDGLDAVVELIGGTDKALEIAQATLCGGRHLITANKALLAEHGEQLGRWATDGGVRIGGEAAVAGSIPILRVLRGALAADRIEEIAGILNGTCNYIISAMEDGSSFEDALGEAQAKGFAEADPTLDLDGSDATQKIAILAHVAFGVPMDTQSVDTGGMNQLEVLDIQASSRLGYRCRHLATARRTADSIGAQAALVLVPQDSPLARIRGETNAVLLRCAAAGEQMLQGAGAGGTPTASAVMADVVDIARRPDATETMGRLVPQVAYGTVSEDLRRRYLRLELSDEPGSLSSLTARFAANGINIDVVEQHPGSQPGRRRVIFVLGETTDATMAKVGEEMRQMDAIFSPPLQLRIEETLC